MVDLTPYSSIRPFMGPLDSWLSPNDAVRIQAYSLYEAMYRNVPDSFKIIQRGTDANPIYVPSAKTIVEAKNRFLAKKWTYTLDPRLGTPDERATLDAMLASLFRREMVWSKFATQKRYGLIRGDAVWHIVADPAKPAGKRISIYEVDPASYFPIEDPWNPDKLLGVHLVDPVEVEPGSGKMVIKRQTYRKESDGTITYELSWWETGAWDDRDGSGQTLKKAQQIPQGDWNKPRLITLPSEVTSLPVYHIKNGRAPNDSFGVSEIAGLERLIGAVNQAISDEELTLALDGLGLYATTSGPPVDDDDNETNWKIGPGWVVEIDKDSKFERVNGVTSVSPVMEHLGYIEAKMREASGVPDIAIGNVDVQTAESGIALAFKMAPILSSNEEKEQEILSIMDHMLYDLSTMWLPAYEQMSVPASQAVSIVDDPLPQDRKAVLAEIIQLVTANLISIAYAQQLVSEKLGYEFPEEMLADIVNEAKALAEARNADPFISRMAQELDGSKP